MNYCWLPVPMEHVYKVKKLCLYNHRKNKLAEVFLKVSGLNNPSSGK